MSNGINSRQNEKNSIAMLAAQRQLYEDVGYLDYWNLILSVALPLIFSALQNIGIAWVKHLSFALTFIMIFITIFMARTTKDKKKKAASIQLLFDAYVYQMPWDKKLFGPRKDMGADIAKHSKKILNEAIKEKELHNWYTTTVDAMPLEKGIITCQRENYHWDVGLRKRYRLISIFVLVISVLIVLILGIINNETIPELWLRIIFIIPMVRWLATTVNSLNEDITRLNQMEISICSAEKKSMEELQEIQKSITDHRMSCTKIPSIIYRIFKDNDEDQEHKRVDFSMNDE